MEDKLKNLAAAISIFSEEYDLSLNQTLGILDSDIKQGYINKDLLIKELEMALLDSNFDWFEFAVKNRLIVYDLETYNNTSIKEYIKSLIEKYFNSKSNSV
jgi:hypothetical protein